MNFTATQKAWILLIAIILMSGGGVFLTSLAGGSKLWFAVASGLITASSSVYHALSKSPVEAGDAPNNNKSTQ